MEKNAKKEATTNNKKWSFGRFFRKKKELDSDSTSDDDRKAGFVHTTTQKPRKKEKRKRNSKITSPAFDHIVISSKNENEIFLPFEAIETTESLRSASGSIDRRQRCDPKQRSSRSGGGGGGQQQKQQQPMNSSSDEEIKSHNSSHNSSTLPRYRSDESIGSGGVVGSRRSRAARTERYYKRLSRDENGNMQSVGLPQSGSGRYKTQPVQFNNYDYNRPVPEYHVKNSGSLSSMPNGQHCIYAVPHKVSQNSAVSLEKRSLSYDNHIHLQNMSMSIRREPLAKNAPPPPPPRDPLRRVQVPSSQNDLRPISYAFDKSTGSAVYPMNSRCVSDDKLWGPEGSIYQLNIQRPASAQPPATQPQTRRFITRAERDANHNQMIPAGPEFKYVADAIPRSRKPIHIVKSDAPKIEASPNSAFVTPQSIIRTTKSGLPSPMKTACEFWKQMEQQECKRRSRTIDLSRADKSRSISGSRAIDSIENRRSAYESFRNSYARVNKSVDEVDNIVNGSLFLKPTKDNEKNFLEVTTKPYENKSNSMPNYYLLQQRQARKSTNTPPTNKYEEYIAKKAPQTVVKPVKYVPPPPQRKSLKLSTEDLHKPATNLEDAINELEAIYKSLKLGDEDLLDRAERRDIPTPTDFKKYAVVSDEDDDDEDQSNGEPDVVLDDVAYRNLKHANSMIKTIDPQPPFGIPITPVPPSPNTDYLHVIPDKEQKRNRCVPQNIPDLVTDDLAVRTLRKDVPGMTKPAVAFPNSSQKKKRAVRSMSANIYNLIQRNAAKPSGGSVFDYAELDRALEKAGSLSDIRRDVDDVPATLTLLRNIQQQDRESRRKTSPIFRHPSQGGAVFNLPSTLNSPSRDDVPQKPPVPLPRKSISPEPVQDTSGMEEVLNRIAKEARESSEKLSRDLMELRNEKRFMVKKLLKPEMEELVKDIEVVSKTAKKYEGIILDAIPPSECSPTPKPRKLSKEEEFLRDIDTVSDAAKVYEKILKDVVTIEPPVMVETAQIVLTKSAEVDDFLGSKDSPVVSSPTKSEKEESLASEVDLIEFSNESDVEPKTEKLVIPQLLKPLDPIRSEQVNIIADRCMRQINELSNNMTDESTAENIDNAGDYDNLSEEIPQEAAIICKQDADDIPDYDNIHSDSAVVSEQNVTAAKRQAPLACLDDEEDIDKIMKECESQVHHKTQYTSLSSSDCPKSSSLASSRNQSSSITSIHAFSSSDYVKSSSSEFQTPSTDPIKTFSTTSYDVNSSSVTPNATNSPISTTPSPLLALTPVGGGNEIVENVTAPIQQRSRSQSQYNSSEELAMIFGIPPPIIAKPTATVPKVGTVAKTVAASTTASTVPVNVTAAAGAAVTTGNVQTLKDVSVNACDHDSVAIVANNTSFAITTTNTTITSVVVVDVVDASLTVTAPDVFSAIDQDCSTDLHQLQHDDHDYITIASLRTPEICSYTRLFPSITTTTTTTACLDTIPEVHDIDENDDEYATIDDANVLNRNYTNTVDCMFSENVDIDEEQKTSLSSNPDSGNVSLADFPLHQHQSQPDLSINSVEFSLLQNTELNYSSLYPFVSQISIDTNRNEDQIDGSLDEPIGELDESAETTAERLKEIDDTSDDGKDQNDENCETKDPESSVQDRLSLDNGARESSSLRSRVNMPLAMQSLGNGIHSCARSQSLGENTPTRQGKYLTSPQTRQSLIHHLIIACTGTYGLAGNDFYTIVAIALAVIILMAFLLI